MIVVLGVIGALSILTIVTWMLLTRRLREKYAVLWIAVALAVIIVGIFPDLLLRLTELLGVQLPSNLLFAMAILLLLGVALHLSWELSSAEDEVRRLAEETAIAYTNVEQLEDRVSALEDQYRAAGD
ncbi:putative integral membrane protein [Microbacterium esteraromaticum]|uniref:Putative integral membrane protein n=1 Tax=Microbacterium esteraromaticum TaxID=57043 RepID=A0A1R4JEP3_9MICO|nr:DUF2304 domain-containing protein [Microbacterium esteraromaticum]SJN30580.1 putative integral membrane protein [Microbacterium esteraromaticum]